MKKLLYVIMISIFSSTLILESAFSSGLSCDFSQDNRTYIWNLKFDYDQQRTSLFSWGVSSSINSSLTKRSNAPDWRKEEGKIDLNVDYLLTQKSRIGAFFSQNIYSSEKTKTTISDYGVISKFNLIGVDFIQVLGAKKLDSVDSTRVEIEKSQQGLNFSQTISFSPRISSGSITGVSLSQTASRLKDIPVLKRDFRLSFFKYLSDSPTLDLGKDSLQVAYQEVWAKNKYYAGKTITPQINDQKKKQRAFNLCTSKKVPLGMKMDFTFDFLSNRDRRFCSEWDSLNLTGSQNMYLGLKKQLLQKILLESFYKYMLSELDYTGEQRDQEMEGGELGGEVRAEITRSDSLCLTASIGVTSFYAPVSGLFSDRDVLTILTWGEYLHIFNPYFNLRIEGGVRNFHQIYLSSLYSSANKHDQTYLFSPTVSWQPNSNLILKQNYKIQANYVYYDYEKAMESGNNIITRRASSSSEVIYRYNHRVLFSLGYTYKYKDEGPLIWKDQWVQKLSRDERTNTTNLSVDYQLTRRVNFSSKYTYEKRKSWKHEVEDANGLEGEAVKEKRFVENRFYQNMLSFSLRYLVDKDNYLCLSAAHRLQNEAGSAQEKSDYVTVSVARIF